MKNIILLIAFYSFFNTTCLAQAKAADVIKMDEQLNRIIQLHDYKMADRFYADDFVLTTSSGKVKVKKDMLAEIASSEVTLEVNETSEVKVYNLGNTAVLTGVLHQKGIYKGNNFDAKLLVTDTWVYINAEWKLLAGHATVIK